MFCTFLVLGYCYDTGHARIYISIIYLHIISKMYNTHCNHYKVTSDHQHCSVMKSFPLLLYSAARTHDHCIGGSFACVTSSDPRFHAEVCILSSLPFRLNIAELSDEKSASPYNRIMWYRHLTGVCKCRRVTAFCQVI